MTFAHLALAATIATTPLDSSRNRIEAWLDTQVDAWQYHYDEVEGAERTDFDDSGWETVTVGHRWWPHDSTCWFRTAITVPETIMGFPTEGRRLRLICGMDNEAVAYANGEEKQRFAWWDGDVVLTEKAKPGEIIQVALHGINRPGWGVFLRAELGTDESLALHDSIVGLFKKIDLIETHLGADDTVWRKTIESIYNRLDLDRLTDANIPSDERAQETARLTAEAERELLQIAESTEARVAQVETSLRVLDARIDAGRTKQTPMDYVRMKARIVRSFIQYARDDYAQGTFWRRVRAERTVAYLEQLVRDAIREADAIVRNPALDKPVPRYRTGRLAIRDGAFQQDSHPVYLSGVGHFGQVRRDVPILQEYGLNVIQIEIGPNSVVMEDGTVSLEGLQSSILDVLKQAEESNVAVCVLLSPHYFPGWALEKHPELKEAGQGFQKYDIDHPVAREIIERFLRTVVPRITAYKSLNSFCLSNEPQYVSRTEVSAKLFHAWLKERHGSVDRLNALYGTHYSGFSDVPQATRDDSDPPYIDWCEFNQERFRDWHRWMGDIIHSIAPGVPVHAKSMAHSWGGWEHFGLGVNHEDFANLGRVTGNDCFAPPTREDEYPHAQHWMLQAMHYDFQRSAAPENPIFNTENHLIPDDDPVFTPGGHIYTGLWQGAVYGMGGSTIWVWERGEGKDTKDNILTRPNCVEAAGRASLDLMRLGPTVARLAKLEPEVGLFHAWHSFARTNDTAEASVAAYEGLANLGVRIRIVTEKTIAQGALEGLAAVVVAKTSRVHPETARAFERYVGGGGTVFALEPCFTMDQYGRETPELSGWLETGARADRLVRLDTPVTARAWRDLVGERLRQMERGTPLALTDAHGDALWSVLWLVLDDRERYIVNVVNQRRFSQTIQLPLQPHATVTDLISGETFSRTIELEPLRPLLLSVDKKDLHRFKKAKEPLY